ncbi:Ger(x)C family spore germination protein [Bacillus sp. C1]
MEKCKRKIILLSFLCVLVLTGCLPKSIIDDINLIQGAVYDTSENDKNKIKVTFVSPIQQKGSKVQVFEGTGNAVKQVKFETALESPQPFANGQIRVALFTTKLAKRGISSTFDTLSRDVSIGNSLYVGLLEGRGLELAQGKYSNSYTVAIYIKKLLEHNMETGPLPTNNLYLSTFRYYRIGQDSYLPILKKDKDKIKITGVGLFKQDIYVGKVEPQNMFVFKGLLEKHRLDSHEFKTNSGYTVINNIRSTPTYHVTIKNGKPSFLITVKIDARIQELSKNINLESKKNTEKIARNVEKQLHASATKLIKKFKSLHVDPLGLGAKYRQHYRPFKLKEWEEMYKDVPITVKYNVNITNSGLIE